MTIPPRDRVGVLTVRVWFEISAAGWRARITRSHDVESGVAQTSVTSDLGTVYQTVKEWLEEFVDGA